MTDSPTPHRVDRLWPDPAADLSLDDAMAGFEPPAPVDGRPGVAINMVTSVDGRAQLDGTAEGLGSRADRSLMRHYRAAFDAVGSGVGHAPRDRRLAARRGRARGAARRPRVAHRTPPAS